ncbi:MAG: DNA polymerase III subunit gamma/tau [Planctomycetaceae bacterium]|nr:DNA polymerase III subunit gamma/tau [Planctomycetaceae bacterium]
MAPPARAAKPPTPPPVEPSGYTVVARRYRPQRFEDVVGQDHVVQALRNAIRLNRVTHAYLFCGTRGVGKTSLARIFAKCLNCVQGPTESPCLICDICQAIAVGQDVDVIEIDGASNNGVEAVRELRQNAGLRPSRARFKIYYIDEVHMLSTGAFNALLKTLEEPPEHVKFFFATTEANKIPITVLSRCQRYDFAGIAPELIVATLAEIGAREGVEAEPEALRTIARRAAGSMRDAQSLLDQLLSSSNGRLTVEEVHRLLGTASDERLLDLIDALADHDAAAVLTQVDRAVREGVQPTDLLNGLLEFLRDLMVLSTGAEGTLLAATPRQRPRLQALIDRWPIDAILAALQIAAETRGKLRGSPHGRILVELALVRVARLENLSDLGELIARLAALESGAVPPTSVNHAALSAIKKKLTSPEPAVPASHQDSSSGPAPPGPPRATRSPADDGSPLSLEAARQAWPEVIKLVGLRFGKGLGLVAPSAISGPNLLVIEVPPRYNWVVDECESVEARARIEQALQRLLHRPVSVRFDRSAEAEPRESPAQAATPGRRGDPAGDPMVQKVVELFEARPLHLEYEEDSSPSASS